MLHLIYLNPCLFHLQRSIKWKRNLRGFSSLVLLNQFSFLIGQPKSFPCWKWTTVHVCGDFKLTINQAKKGGDLPYSKSEGLVLSAGRRQTFTNLGISHAYQQLFLDEESKQFVTIKTKYKYNRLVFGLASIRAIFQRTKKEKKKKAYCREFQMWHCTTTRFWSQGKQKRSTSVTWTRFSRGCQRQGCG